MNGLDSPAPLSAHDLPPALEAASIALEWSTKERNRLEREIRQTTSIEELARLHDLWQEVIQMQEAADARQRELLQLMASMN